jgi:hypothetical protein
VTRSITVSRLFYPAARPWRSGKHVPFIRLCGLWLMRAGFSQGARLRVTVSPGEIKLELAE